MKDERNVVLDTKKICYFVYNLKHINKHNQPNDEIVVLKYFEAMKMEKFVSSCHPIKMY